MAKIVDITEKLDFDGNPVIRVKDVELEVNADASTMLKVMGVLGRQEDPGPREILEMYELIFGEAERDRIEKMKLSFRDFTKIVYTAISLVNGEDDGLGEQ